MVAAAGFDLKSIAVLEPASSKLVEAGFSYMEKLAGFCDSNATGVEFMKGLQNKLAWESVGELAFFIAPIERIQRALGIPDFRSLFGGVFPPPFATLRPPPSPRQKAGQWLFRAKCSFPLLNRLSSLLNRREHNVIPSRRSMIRLKSKRGSVKFRSHIHRVNGLTGIKTHHHSSPWHRASHCPSGTRMRVEVNAIAKTYSLLAR
jgi:hypothetical protein